MNNIQNYGMTNYQMGFQAGRSKKYGNMAKEEYKELKKAIDNAERLMDKPEHLRTKRENRIVKFYKELCDLIPKK